MIDLEEEYLVLVRELLFRYLPGYEVRLFGSRARGTSKKFSDIDLAVVGAAAVPEQTLSELRDAFADSDLPYRVDLLDWQKVNPEFRKVIQDGGYEVVQEAYGEQG